MAVVHEQEGVTPAPKKDDVQAPPPALGITDGLFLAIILWGCLELWIPGFTESVVGAPAWIADILKYGVTFPTIEIPPLDFYLVPVVALAAIGLLSLVLWRWIGAESVWVAIFLLWGATEAALAFLR